MSSHAYCGITTKHYELRLANFAHDNHPSFSLTILRMSSTGIWMPELRIKKQNGNRSQTKTTLLKWCLNGTGGGKIRYY
jgi:hypothetical protein